LKKTLLFVFPLLVFAVSGCLNMVGRPESVLKSLEKEVLRGNVDRILELYAETVEISTTANPSGRPVTKADLRYYYNRFLTEREISSFSLNVESVEKPSSGQAVIYANFTLSFRYDDKDYSVEAETSFSLSKAGRKWRITGEWNNPILSIYEPASKSPEY